MKVRRVVINGYYGMGNAGDEAVLACAIEEMRSFRPEMEITVLSGDPSATSARFGVRSVSRKSMEALRQIASHDLYISGGGSLLQDATSRASIIYYIGLMGMAKLARTPYAIYANGVGPIKNGWAKGLVRMAVEGASSVSVRDAASMRLLEEIGVVRDDMLLTTDPVFGIKAASEQEVLVQVAKAAGADAGGYLAKHRGKIVLFALREWDGLDAGMPALREMARMTVDAGYRPVGLAFQPKSDEAALVRMRKECQMEWPIIPCDFHPVVTAGIFTMAGLTVGMRLHSLIMSAAACVPAFGISYDPKVDALFETMPLGRCVKVTELREKGTMELSSLISGMDAQKARIESTLPAVREKAAGTIEFILRKAEA